MRICVAIVLVLCSLVADAKAEILRCSASGRDGDFEMKVEVDIVLPTDGEYDKSLTAVTAEKGNFVTILGGTAPKGLGLIDVAITNTWRGASNLYKQRHDLVVTRQPGGGWSLVGFYFEKGYPVLVKADTWDPSKRFTLTTSAWTL